MNKSRGLSERTSDIVLVAITAVVLIIVAYPLYYVLIASVSDPYDVYAGKTFLLPSGFTLDGYAAVFQDPNIVSGFLNSVKYTLIGTVFSVTMLYITAYPMAQRDLPGRKFFSIFFLITMYFGGGLIPTFLLIYKLGIYNTIWSMILPSVSIWNIILCRTFFMSIPGEVAESATIDGANHFQPLWRISLPLSKPVLAVIAIYTIVGVWNSWFNAMVYLPNENLHPLQMYLQRILIAQTVDLKKIMTMSEMQDAVKKMLSSQQLKYTMIFFISAPIMLIYPCFQKYFIKGVMLGSLKG